MASATQMPAARPPQNAQAATQGMQALLRTVLRDPKGYFKLSQVTVTLGSGVADWTLLLNARNPEEPPDFILDELSDNFIHYPDLKTLQAWSLEQPASLLNLLLEMRALFRENRARRAISFSNEKTGFELESLLGLERESEIRLLDKEQLQVECRVPIRRTSSSEETVEGGKGEVVCHLVLILDQELAQVRTHLQYPEQISEELRAVCPGWEPGSTHVFDFVPMVQSKVMLKLQSLDIRKRFLESLAVTLSPLYVDAALFLRASFLVELDKAFEAVVHVRLSSNFPDDQPTLVLQSVSFLVDRQPIHDVILEYPYSPRWDMPQMAAHVIATLTSKIREFRVKVQSTCQDAPAA